MANYYTETTLQKFRGALNEAKDAVKAGQNLHTRISNGNSKMGAVASVSTLPYITCPACCRNTCGPNCCAAKLANLRPSVLRSWAFNTALAILRPDVYWAGVDAACKGVRYFRFHVGGDIMNAEYFSHMVKIATDNPATEILAFTKRFDVVNAWQDANGSLPANLHIMFSGWTNLCPVNPYNLPETNIFAKGSEPDDAWKICGGNCFNCACRGVGCWQAQRGDVIAFKLH